MNAAQKLYVAWTNAPDFEGVDLGVAAEQTAEQARLNRAPHAYRGTPPRPHYPQGVAKTRRLFKGHRP